MIIELTLHRSRMFGTSFEMALSMQTRRKNKNSFDEDHSFSFAKLSENKFVCHNRIPYVVDYASLCPCPHEFLCVNMKLNPYRLI